jgi:CBS domain-containing protein
MSEKPDLRRETTRDKVLDLETPISNYVKPSVSLDEGETVLVAAKKMVGEEMGAVIVTRSNEPAGILTERDVLKVVAAGKDPIRTKLWQVMSFPILVIDYSSTVGEAIRMMSENRVRRLAVTAKDPTMKSGRRLVGLINRWTLVGGDVGGRVPLPQLEPVKRFTCPYCGQVTSNNEQLTKHVDNLHIGRGLLEGRKDKW